MAEEKAHVHAYLRLISEIRLRVQETEPEVHHRAVEAFQLPRLPAEFPAQREIPVLRGGLGWGPDAEFEISDLRFPEPPPQPSPGVPGEGEEGEEVTKDSNPPAAI